MSTAQAEASRTETVHFSISGEFLTDHYRSLVREGNWRMAFEQLQDAFESDMDLETVIDILSGKKRLEGINDLSLEDDEAYQDDQWVFDQYFVYFNNLFFFENKAYRAYACVEVLDYEDMRAAKDLYEMSPFTKREWNEVRALTYANDGSRDRAFHKPDLGWILCEPVNRDFPIWIRKNDIERMSNIEGYRSLRGLLRFNTRDQIEFQDRQDDSDALGDDAPSPSSPVLEAASAKLDSFLEDSRRADEAAENLEVLRQEIAQKADENGGWLELHDESRDKTYTLPRNAFYRWCLSSSSAWESIDWTPVSPQGMKMGGDDPNHTDWWLFTGYDLEDGYDDELMSFFSCERFRIHKELTGHDFTTLIRDHSTPDVSDRIARHVDSPDKIYMINRNDLVIIPTASPEFEAVAHKCAEIGAVLMTEVGGKLCHLATVGREFGLTLLMLPDARSLLPMGCNLDLDMEQGKLEIKDLDAETIFTMKLSGQMYR